MFGHPNRGVKGVLLLDGQCIADTVQCVHCQRHYERVPGSGKVRGFCLRCMGPTCGTARCDVCVPFERKLELYEQGRLAVFR